MSKIAVSCVCLGLVLFVSVPAEGQNAEAAQTKARALENAAKKTSDAAVLKAAEQPDLKTIGFIPLIVSNDGTNFSIQVPVTPAHGTAAYRLESETEDTLDIASIVKEKSEIRGSYPDGLTDPTFANRSLLPANMLLPQTQVMLPGRPAFIEVQFIWCAKTLPYKNHPATPTCESSDPPQYSGADEYADSVCRGDQSCKDSVRKVGSYPRQLCPQPIKSSDPTKLIWQPCTIDAIYSAQDLHQGGGSGPVPQDQAVSLIPVFVLSQKQLLIADQLSYLQNSAMSAEFQS